MITHAMKWSCFCHVLNRNFTVSNLVNICKQTSAFHCMKRYKTKFVPEFSIWRPSSILKKSDTPLITDKQIKIVETQSLLQFKTDEYCLNTLQEAVVFAQELDDVNTDNVEPLYTVLENVPLYLRDDSPEPFCQESILKNAEKVYEDYFVVPLETVQKTST